MKRKTLEKLADFIGLTIGVIALFIISIIVFSSIRNWDSLAYFWAVIGIILMISRIIIGRKLKWNL